MKIAITGLGTATTQNFIKALRKPDLDFSFLPENSVTFLAMDMDKNCSGKYLLSDQDEFWQCKSATEDGFAAELLGKVQDRGAKLLVSIVDQEWSELVYEYRRFGWRREDHLKYRFKTSLQLGLERTLLGDKLWQSQNFNRYKHIDFNSPKVYLTVSDALTGVAVEGPIIIRPRFGVASRGVKVCKTPTEFLAALESYKRPTDLVFTQYIEGDEITVDFLYNHRNYSNSDKEVLSFCPRKRVEIKAGVATKSEILSHDELPYNFKRQLSYIAQASGVEETICCAQAIRDKDNNYWWFELNPRFGGGSIASVEAGINLPYMYLQMLYQENPTYQTDYKKCLVVRHLNEEVIDL